MPAYSIPNNAFSFGLPFHLCKIWAYASELGAGAWSTYLEWHTCFMRCAGRTVAHFAGLPLLVWNFHPIGMLGQVQLGPHYFQSVTAVVELRSASGYCAEESPNLSLKSLLLGTQLWQGGVTQQNVSLEACSSRRDITLFCWELGKGSHYFWAPLSQSSSEEGLGCVSNAKILTVSTEI